MPLAGAAAYRFFGTLDEASVAAAERLVSMIRAASATNDGCPFRLALAGGTTPERLYRLLAAPPFAGDIVWSRVRFFWGDERFVPHTDAASNYRLAAAALLDPLRIPARHRFPVPVDGRDPAACARRYETVVQGWRDRDGLLFDCVLLGMGADGHTLSLFPGRPSLDVWDRLVLAEPEPVGCPAVPRISLTLAAVAASRQVLFLVAGSEKFGMVEAIRTGRLDVPAARVVCRGEVVWFVGREA